MYLLFIWCLTTLCVKMGVQVFERVKKETGKKERERAIVNQSFFFSLSSCSCNETTFFLSLPCFLHLRLYNFPTGWSEIPSHHSSVKQLACHFSSLKIKFDQKQEVLLFVFLLSLSIHYHDIVNLTQWCVIKFWEKVCNKDIWQTVAGTWIILLVCTTLNGNDLCNMLQIVIPYSNQKLVVKVSW